MRLHGGFPPAVLVLYGIGIAADLIVHLLTGSRAGDRSIGAGDLAVAFQASLLWPVDLLFRLLLAGLG